ncbi:hypothetical protein SV7mr_43750 [Stieleria bergensis]|uniref:DUF6677 domain-containing protein n=1 Tax=Stieleria bergensis TaxID=2528025 RepID=A0A517T0C2_9BACT|nr:hypothetical protein SV7mr_43750 [Planctomycetes bacterium SV_7m_r]
MSTVRNVIEVDSEKVDLKSRSLAAFLAWLIPGAGHYYQGRTIKAGLFFVCIMSTWLLGFALGGFNVVYASWQPGDRRWQYPLQAGVGLAAMPAIVQSLHAKSNTIDNQTKPGFQPFFKGFMAPPNRPVLDNEVDEVSAYYARYGAGYEMGTLYTIIAGLLNILVIYDAYSGPLSVPISGRRPKDDEDEEQASENTEKQAEPASPAEV